MNKLAFALQLAVTAATLSAQNVDTGQRAKFGIKLSSAIPVSSEFSDIVYSGVDFALFIEKPIEDKKAMRVALEYAIFNPKGYFLGDGTTSYDGSEMLRLECSYIRRMVSHNRGLYILAGGGAVRATATNEISGIIPYPPPAFDVGYAKDNVGDGAIVATSFRPGISIKTSQNTTAVFAAAGIGYNFNRRFGLELKYSLPINLKFSNEDGAVSWGFSQFGVSIRF